MKMKKLRKCPFCNKEVEIEYSKKRDRYRIICKHYSCGFIKTFWWCNKGYMISQWNFKCEGKKLK